MSLPNKYICDYGQIYSSEAGIIACQNARHSTALDNELADALDFLRENGVSEYE